MTTEEEAESWVQGLIEDFLRIGVDAEKDDGGSSWNKKG